MKITKYHQSCLVVETSEKRILVDPGSFGLTDDMVKEKWTNIDAILITHKHGDHCDENSVNAIVKRDGAKVYTSKEVQQAFNILNVNIVKAGDKFSIGKVQIEVTYAVHGYLTQMKGKEVKENVGFILSDEKTSLYTTSDTINFNNDYNCEILCMPFNGNGLTFGLVDGMGFVKGIAPKLLLPIHMEHPIPNFNPDTKSLIKMCKEEDVQCKILEFGETIEV